jgi:ATP-dependent helicase HepA
VVIVQGLGYTRATFLQASEYVLNMNDFVVGQRWLSETETDLGLGIVQESDYRLVTLYFPGAEEERVYAKDNAPLSRVHYKAGDEVELVDGQKYLVHNSEEVNDLVFYQLAIDEGSETMSAVPETQLSHVLKLKHAKDRLFSRQLDSPRWFELRHAALEAQQHCHSLQVNGLTGARVDLIPHQLYIAHEVAQRYAPRVLLADEVGLGKTIEAGLIIHQQLVTNRAERVLIVVPKSLTHQWFVEMYRRFNLHFSIFDQARIDESGQSATDNPFLSQQLILCSQDFLLTEQAQAMLEVDWDLLVVDEAHHLDWHPQEASAEYLMVEALSKNSKGLLLLTATPEQLGVEGHFARLRLLDPDRFSSLDSFIEQQAQYEKLADLVEKLESSDQLEGEHKVLLSTFLDAEEIESKSNQELVHDLLECYGTGRVLFRNTRKNIQGFPRRKVFSYPLNEDENTQADTELLNRLYPESASDNDSWCQTDKRVEWLFEFCKEHPQEKILLICALKNTAMDLELFLRYRKGFKTAVFHEDMDLISRDRAAAYFADEEDGAQILVCSEIGSEGRNFQFSSNLVLFDLPLIPDLLEQRIGRLDRIGQKNDIHIHVPFCENSAQALLFDWYHEGINAFEHTNPAGEAIYAHCESDLLDALSDPADSDQKQRLIEKTHALTLEVKESLEKGRDRLLEKASYHNEKAAALVELINEEQSHQPKAFLEQVFDRFGVHSEEHSPGCSILHPTDHMFIGEFPYLPSDGLTVTYDRSTALTREDMGFLSWEHPMSAAAIDLVLSEEKGKACVAVLKNKAIKPGTLLLELIFKVEVVAPKHFQANRFLPATKIRVLMDGQGRDLSASVSHENISKQVHKLQKTIGKKILSSEEKRISALIEKAEGVANEKAQTLKEKALASMKTLLNEEHERLHLLKNRNAGIRDEELAFLELRKQHLENYIRDASSQLDGVRVLVTSND